MKIYWNPKIEEALKNCQQEHEEFQGLKLISDEDFLKGLKGVD